MAEAEINVIAHLLEVEQEASSLIQGAQAEADRRVSAARAQADAEYKRKYDEMIGKLDADYRNKIDGIAAAYDRAGKSYQAAVEKTARNNAAFTAALENILARE